MFVDECILNRSNQGIVRNESAAEMVFLRNILRILKLIPIMAGTDARSSNFCSNLSMTSRKNLKSLIWAVIISDLSQFNPSLFLNIPRSITKHPNAMAIVEFLKQTSVDENPWLVQLSLDFISGLKKDVWKSTCLEDILNDMCSYVFNQFVARKDDGSMFTKSQISYVHARRLY